MGAEVTASQPRAAVHVDAASSLHSQGPPWGMRSRTRGPDGQLLGRR